MEPDERAQRKEANLEVLREHHPDLTANLEAYVPRTELVFDDEGNPDVMLEGTPFYGQPLDEHVARQLEGFWRSPSRFSLQILQPTSLDDVGARVLHNVLKRATEAEVTFGQVQQTRKAFFVLVFGVGLGRHLDELVDETGCQALFLVEPNLELIYHSLEVFDWAALLERLKERGCRTRFFLGQDPLALNMNLRNHLRGTNPSSLDGTYLFTHYNSPLFEQTRAFLLKDAFLVVAGLGFYDDEVIMIRNNHANLYSGTSRLYVRPERPQQPLPALIVGSGPSLDKTMGHIKANADTAVVISCGSALRPLLAEGIVPDFHIELENIKVYALVEQVFQEFDLSPICLITSTTVESSILQFFDNIVYYYRASLSPFKIWCDDDRSCLENPNPTVVNAGLSFAQEVGFREFYLFGTDMGAKGTDRHHSKEAYHYTEGAVFDVKPFNWQVPGNFGGIVNTSTDLYWTRDSLERAISQHARGRSYFNCSDGALIGGTLAKHARSVKLPEVEGGKAETVRAIIESFPIYTAEEFDAKWSDDTIVEDIDTFMDATVTLFTEVEDFKDKTYLVDAFRLLADTTELMAMAMVFRGTILQILTANEYYLNRVMDLDRYDEVAEIMREELLDCLERLREDAKAKFGTLSADAAVNTPRPAD